MQDHFGQSYCTNVTLLSVELDQWVDWTTRKKERKTERKKDRASKSSPVLAYYTFSQDWLKPMKERPLRTIILY